MSTLTLVRHDGRLTGMGSEANEARSFFVLIPLSIITNGGGQSVTDRPLRALSRVLVTRANEKYYLCRWIDRRLRACHHTLRRNSFDTILVSFIICLAKAMIHIISDGIVQISHLGRDGEERQRRYLG